MKISQTTNVELIAKLNQHVHDLHVQLYPDVFKEYHYEDIKVFFQGVITKDNYIFLILEDDDIPLGYAWIELKNYPDTPFKKTYKSVYVHQISIAESQRSKGYGSALMDEIEAIAKRLEINRIELDYWTGNVLAGNFYKKKHFVPYREFVYKDIT